MSQPALVISPTLTILDGNSTTLSTDLTRHFGKRHDDVLRAIDNLCTQLGEEHLHNFAKTKECPTSLFKWRSHFGKSLPPHPRRFLAAGHGLHGQQGAGIQAGLHRRLHPHASPAANAHLRPRPNRPCPPRSSHCHGQGLPVGV